MQHLLAGQGDVTGRGLNQPAVADLAVAGDADFIAPRGGRDIAIGAVALLDHKAVARRQGGLASRGGNGPGVLHLFAEQQHITAARSGGGGHLGLDLRATLDRHLAGGLGESGRAVA